MSVLGAKVLGARVECTSFGLATDCSLTFFCENLSEKNKEVRLRYDCSKVQVYGFRIRANGEEAIGKPFEKKIGENVFDDEISKGKSPFSCSFENGAIVLQIGNLAPHAKCEMTILMSFLLNSSLQNQAQLLLPLPNCKTSGKWILDTPKDVFAGYGFKITNIERDFLEFEGESTSLILTLKRQNLNGQIEISQNGDATAMICVPMYPPKISGDKLEIIFLVDQSGSMTGIRNDQTKLALQLFLRSMPDKCYFNIVRFGTAYKCLFEKSQRYSEETLKLATELVNGLDANMESTCLSKPLLHIFQTPLIEGIARRVMILSDGCVDNRDETIAAVKQDGKYRKNIFFVHHFIKLRQKRKERLFIIIFLKVLEGQEYFHLELGLTMTKY